MPVTLYLCLHAETSWAGIAMHKPGCRQPSELASRLRCTLWAQLHHLQYLTLQLCVHWRQVNNCASLKGSGVQRPQPESHGQAASHKVFDAAWQQHAGQPIPTGTACCIHNTHPLYSLVFTKNCLHAVCAAANMSQSHEL